MVEHVTGHCGALHSKAGRGRAWNDNAGRGKAWLGLVWFGREGDFSPSLILI